MIRDARRDTRSRIALHNAAGLFLLKADQQQFRLKSVDDVSVSGMGLQLPVPLHTGTSVTLTYTELDWHVTIRGHVMWNGLGPRSEMTATAPYRHGIRFEPTQNDDNALFFLALREFLDPFG
jgi:hypothetical protein